MSEPKHINPHHGPCTLSSHTSFTVTTMARFVFILTLLAAAAHAGPMPDVLERDYPTGNSPVAECKKISVIVTILEAHKATPFCSSYLGIPAVTSTTTV